MTKKCQWPLWGNSERPTGEFCGRECVGTYCDEHKKLTTQQAKPKHKFFAAGSAPQGRRKNMYQNGAKVFRNPARRLKDGV